MADFDEVQYTRDQAAKELLLIQGHSSDGSATEAGCTCIEEKHLLHLEALADEGQTLSPSEQEKAWYKDLAELARAKRKQILNEEWKTEGNPGSRAYLPHGLTECEASHPKIQKKLSSCIKAAEIKCCGEHTKDYEKCTCNPVAVCRSSVSCP